MTATVATDTYSASWDAFGGFGFVRAEAYVGKTSVEPITGEIVGFVSIDQWEGAYGERSDVGVATKSLVLPSDLRAALEPQLTDPLWESDPVAGGVSAYRVVDDVVYYTTGGSAFDVYKLNAVTGERTVAPGFPISESRHVGRSGESNVGNSGRGFVLVDGPEHTDSEFIDTGDGQRKPVFSDAFGRGIWQAASESSLDPEQSAIRYAYVHDAADEWLYLESPPTFTPQMEPGFLGFPWASFNVSTDGKLVSVVVLYSDDGSISRQWSFPVPNDDQNHGPRVVMTNSGTITDQPIRVRESPVGFATSTRSLRSHDGWVAIYSEGVVITRIVDSSPLTTTVLIDDLSILGSPIAAQWLTDDLIVISSEQVYSHRGPSPVLIDTALGEVVSLPSDVRGIVGSRVYDSGFWTMKNDPEDGVNRDVMERVECSRR